MASLNLPVQLTSFIGREQEIAAVKSLLFSAHLVTLKGAGGSGKTRLAIQVANEAAETFEDGAWFVDLASLNEPGLLPQLVVESLGLRFASTQPLLDLLLNSLRPKRLLLVLDNCEHLIAASAQLAQQVLTHAPDLRILATSREPLAIAGETIYPVSGLACPSVHVRPESISQNIEFDAVRLFIERTQAISPNYKLDLKNAQFITEICRRLDGLPLAIELASARINVLTVQEISARLTDRFALLTSGRRTDRIPRHQTLRAAMDWSYALLSAEEQIFLVRLAVFSAGWTLDTAEAVCSEIGIGEGRTLDLLSSLVDKSFIIADTSGRSQARYR
ncbi:adenylate/guanylate cyclase domain-containing protein, partial [bacterium]|nr:adenylate/guanylate cyclase domain-containing protein [bacterium]